MSLTLRLPASQSGYPETNLDVELLEIGASASVRVRLPGDQDLQGLHHLADLWDEADDDRETIHITSNEPFALLLADRFAPLGHARLFEIGYRAGEPVASLYGPGEAAFATFADGRWRWHGGPESAPLLLIGTPLALRSLDRSWTPPQVVPGHRHRRSPLAERRGERLVSA